MSSAFLLARLLAIAPDGIVRFDELAEWAATMLAPLLPDACVPEQCGLFVATSDAGAAAAISLWAEALDQGPSFASPRDFPWTLASSPAGHIAAHLGLRGPNFTLVGGGEAATAALLHALDDLEQGRISQAIVVALDMMPEAHPDEGEAAVAGLCLAGTPSPHASAVVERTVGPGTASAGSFAVTLLARACAALDRGEPIVVGEREEGWIAFRPVTPAPRSA